MRSEVMELGKLGPLPSHKSVLANSDGEALVKKYQDLIGSIKPPVTDAEARVVLGFSASTSVLSWNGLSFV
jgi:hypothetical protein